MNEPVSHIKQVAATLLMLMNMAITSRHRAYFAMRFMVKTPLKFVEKDSVSIDKKY
jgi:hypothetical protein